MTFVPLKSLILVIFKGTEPTKNYLAIECLKTIKAARDLIAIPFKIARVIEDIRAPSIPFIDSEKNLKPSDYLKTDYDLFFQHFPSHHFSDKNFNVIGPKYISEMPAYTDPSLKSVVASHFLKENQMGIGFGCPNLFIFTTHPNSENKDECKVKTVEAKSFKRAQMVYKESKGGKIQSGIYFIPTNLPEGAFDAIQKAAEQLQGRKDFTCVNTNCRVLKEAGFSIEGTDLANCYLPTTFLENILFRNLYYKGQKIHFDIVKTTPLTLQEYFEQIDTAILTTPNRHKNRNKDSEENRAERGKIAKKKIAEEKELLRKHLIPQLTNEDFTKREIKVGISSFLGDFAARFWGRHTVYEITLKKSEEKTISKLFNSCTLKPFSDEKPNFFTCLKRDYFFSKGMINFLRGHMIGNQNSEKMASHDFLKLLRGSAGAILNYVLLPNKIIITRVNVDQTNAKHRKAADWALTKHALLANREEVYCAGEMWYDKESEKFKMNSESGTYRPKEKAVKTTVKFANDIFKTNRFVYQAK